MKLSKCCNAKVRLNTGMIDRGNTLFNICDNCSMACDTIEKEDMDNYNNGSGGNDEGGGGGGGGFPPINFEKSTVKFSDNRYSSVHKVEEEYTVEKIVENHYEQALTDFFKVFNAEISDLVVEIKTIDGKTVRMSYKENQERLAEEQ